jgi:hypothetical protein
MQPQPLPLDTRIAIERGAEALRLMRQALQRADQELERYEAQFVKVSNPAEKARILHRAILQVCANVLPNARIECAADAQAELLAVAQTQTNG